MQIKNYYLLLTMARSFDDYHVNNKFTHLVCSIFYTNSDRIEILKNFPELQIIIRVICDNNLTEYFNVKENKKNIYKELRKKSGVYVFINNITGELYVGSSINLTKRMVSYYYNYNSNKLSKLMIIRAMKKYGLENFSLGIKEFCKQDPKLCLSLEQK